MKIHIFLFKKRLVPKLYCSSWTNSLESCLFVENPSGLTQNLETVVKESDADVEADADAQLKYMVL
jgi:hypothetical protein